jgi:hypothetical protein
VDRHKSLISNKLRKKQNQRHAPRHGAIYRLSHADAKFLSSPITNLQETTADPSTSKAGRLVSPSKSLGKITNDATGTVARNRGAENSPQPVTDYS